MRGILVDTSVWIDLFRGTETTGVQRLETALGNRMDIYLCGLIRTEILQGIPTEHDVARTKRILDHYRDLPLQDSTYLLAADIFRTGRRKGITVRKTIDCLIAAIAIEQKVELLHDDRDFDGIESLTTLKIHR